MKRLVSGVIALLLALLPSGLVSGQVPSADNAVSGKVIRMEGSFLEPLHKRDSALIADQFRYGFHLKDVVRGTQFALPDLSKGLMDSIDVVSPWLVDTVKVHGKKKSPDAYDIDVSLVITSFEEGKRELVPLAVARASANGAVDTLVFNPQTIEFFTIPVDTTTYVIHDIKGQVKYPFSASEIIPYAAAVWIVAFLAILIWALLARKRKASEQAAYKDPPHLVALRKLDRFRSSKYWAQDKQKAFYSGITDAMREYIAARYGFDAMEMTTADIFKILRCTDVPADLYEEMKTLFETADFVKFAKAFASDEENAAALPAAVRFVTTTYQTQIEKEEAEKASAAASASDEKKGGKA